MEDLERGQQGTSMGETRRPQGWSCGAVKVGLLETRRENLSGETILGVGLSGHTGPLRAPLRGPRNESGRRKDHEGCSLTVCVSR